MIAALLIVFFAGAALLALGAMAASWRSYGRQFLDIREELHASDRGVTVRYSWRETAALPQTAAIYQLAFRPKADCLPFQPELPVAA